MSDSSSDWIDEVVTQSTEAATVEDSAPTAEATKQSVETEESSVEDSTDGEAETQPGKTSENDSDVSDSAEQKMVPLAGLKDERGKRQLAEQRAAELEARLAALESARQEPTASDGDSVDDQYWTDPKGYVERMLAQTQQRTKLEVSEMFARQQFADYDDLVNQYVAPLLEIDPKTGMVKDIATARYLSQQPNPAVAAYNYAKSIKELQSFESPEQLRESIRKEERERAETELRKKLAVESASSIPKTTARAGVKGDEKPVPSQAEILTEMFGEGAV